MARRSTSRIRDYADRIAAKRAKPLSDYCEDHSSNDHSPSCPSWQAREPAKQELFDAVTGDYVDEHGNPVVTKAAKNTARANKTAKRILKRKGAVTVGGDLSDEAISGVTLDVDSRGFITGATFTIPVPKMKTLSPKDFIERIKATVELEIELLKEQRL